MIVRKNTAYRFVLKLKKAKKQNPQKKKKTQNPPHQCDKCGHCCGIMNSPQHPGLPPHGAGDLQPLVLTVPLLLLSNTIDVPISPFLFFQIQLKLENTPNQMMRWWKAHKGLKKHKRGEGTRVRLKSVSNRMIRCWAKLRWSRLDEDVLLQVLPLLACPHCYS